MACVSESAQLCNYTKRDVFVCNLGSELVKTCEENFKVIFVPGVM